MRSINFLDTKFLAVNGDLANTINGGTAMLQNDIFRLKSKRQIRVKLPSLENKYLNVSVFEHTIVISASLQNISKNGVVFNLPFASRSFQIPDKVNPESIKAFENDGYLVVEMIEDPGYRTKNRRNIDINFDEEF